MDALVSDFDELKLSAFSKCCRLTGNIHNVTIGPNSQIYQSEGHEVASQTNRNHKSERVRVVKDGPPIRQVLRELEAERVDNVQQTISERYNKYVDFSKSLKEQLRDEWLIQQQNFIHRMQQQEHVIIEALNQYDLNRKTQNEKLLRQYQDTIQRKIKIEQELEKSKERQRKINENFDKVRKVQLGFQSVYQEIIGAIKSCTKSEELKGLLNDDLKLLKTLLDSLEIVVGKCKQGQCPDEAVEQAEIILNNVQELKIRVQEVVDKTNRVEPEIIPKETPPQVERPKTPVLTTSSEFVSSANLQRYNQVQSFLQEHTKSFAELVHDQQMKKFRADCRMAVNVPVNSLLPRPDNLRERYSRIHNLLSGKNVPDGDNQINASRHPQGVAFCMDHLVDRLILQAYLTERPESVFCYATIIVTLWNDFPSFGNLILGHFYKQCPYLVPYYIPMLEGQSSIDYYTSLGYKYKNGQIEKQDEFLKRIIGIFRSYFAIMVTKPKGGSTNPFGIENGWNFLTSTLKLEPQLDISATAVYIFLETVGFEMENTYRGAFRKLLHIIRVVYLPKLKKIDNGGAVFRLESLLEDHTKTKHFQKPVGILPNNYW